MPNGKYFGEKLKGMWVFTLVSTTSVGSTGNYFFLLHKTHKKFFSQDSKVCTEDLLDCYWKQVKKDHGCTVGCQGVYADIWYKSENNEDKTFLDIENFEELQMEYQKFKQNYAKNLLFNSSRVNYSEY